MELTSQRLKLAMLNAEYKIVSSFGSMRAKQNMLETLVILRTAVRVSQEYSANNDLFDNLLNRRH